MFCDQVPRLKKYCKYDDFIPVSCLFQVHGWNIHTLAKIKYSPHWTLSSETPAGWREKEIRLSN